MQFRALSVVSLLALASLGGLNPACGQQGTGPGSSGSAPDAGQQAPAGPRNTTEYNHPSLAIEGYDPVAYFPEGGGKPLKGDKKFAHEHRGVTYHFASQANRDAFIANPAKYEPAYGGWCAYAMASGEKVEIDPKASRITNGRLLLFYRDFLTDTRKPWAKDEAALIAKADAAWAKRTGEQPPNQQTPGQTAPGTTPTP